MATQVICDECGEPIDQTQAYYQVVATKMQVVFNGSEVTTTFVSDTELACTVPDIVTGTYDVLVRQDGTDTDPAAFTVT